VVRLRSEAIVDYAVGGDGITILTSNDGGQVRVRDNPAGIATQIRRLEDASR
jgi:hypothetical protein